MTVNFDFCIDCTIEMDPKLFEQVPAAVANAVKSDRVVKFMLTANPQKFFIKCATDMKTDPGTGHKHGFIKLTAEPVHKQD